MSSITKSLYTCDKCGNKQIRPSGIVMALCSKCKTTMTETDRIPSVCQTIQLTHEQEYSLNTNGWGLIPANQVNRFPKQRNQYLVNIDKVIALKGTDLIITFQCASFRGLFNPYQGQIIDPTTNKWSFSTIETQPYYSKYVLDILHNTYSIGIITHRVIELTPSKLKELIKLDNTYGKYTHVVIADITKAGKPYVYVYITASDGSTNITEPIRVIPVSDIGSTHRVFTQIVREYRS